MELLTDLDPDKMRLIIDRLRFFKNFTEYEKKRIVAMHTSFFSVKMGEYIIREDKRDTSFFILIMGRVSVIKKARSTPLAQLNPGDFFGEVSFLTGAPRTTNVLADERSVVMQVDQELMAKLSADIREKIKDRIIEKLVKRIDDMNNTLMTLSTGMRWD